MGDSSRKFTALTHRITRETDPPQSLIMEIGPCRGSLLNRKSGGKGPAKRRRKRNANLSYRRRVYAILRRIVW